MLRFIQDAFARLWNDRRGNVFILFAASSIPLMLVMGGAVDFSRYARYKTELANSVDAAALALARNGEEYTEDEATAFVEDYVESLTVGDEAFTVQGFDVDKTENGYIVEAEGSMETMFLPLGAFTENGTGIMSMDIDIVAEVVHSSNQVELALVFDNTGSMNYSGGSNPCGSGTSRMAGLKCAATTLVEDLMGEMSGEGGPQLKVALVPFEGSVNVGVNTSNPPWWIEWSDEATADDASQPYYTGVNFEQKSFSGTSKKIGPRWLYEKLGISWAGCVEMRAEPYDVLDTTPDTSVPDTLFVPMFWPDEPDSYYAWNNYLDDDYSGSNWEQVQSDLDKYDVSSPSYVDWHYGKKDTTYPYSYGPNRGCPRPITPLTSDEDTIIDAIDDMQAQGATGTFVPVGLAWGWRVLSPEEPFTEGLGPGDEDYDNTVKAIILLTDGENSPTISATSWTNKNDGTFSAYNYPATEVDHDVGPDTVYRRLQALNVDSDPSDSTATSRLDAKTLTLCTNAKGVGIRLYTITFGDLDSTTESLMEDCASLDSSGNPLYYSAPSSDELENIFHAIGEDLSEIHLTM